MKKTKLLQLICLLMCLGISPMKSQDLKFGDDKKFKIVQFTDVHWKADSIASEEAGERMSEVLDAEKPDLVIFTGDVLWNLP